MSGLQNDEVCTIDGIQFDLIAFEVSTITGKALAAIECDKQHDGFAHIWSAVYEGRQVDMVIGDISFTAFPTSPNAMGIGSVHLRPTSCINIKGE